MKQSYLFLALFAAIALVGAYHALFAVPVAVAFTRFLALSGFLLLCTSLMIGPLAVLWPKGFAPLVEARRAVGVSAFVFVLLHFLLTAAVIFKWQLAPLILSGTPFWAAISATLMLFALTITSTDHAIRFLGASNWKNLQRLAYVAFALSFAHFLLKANGLFANAGGKAFVNLAEVFALALGILTILLQIAGFLKRRESAKPPKGAVPVIALPSEPVAAAFKQAIPAPSGASKKE